MCSSDLLHVKTNTGIRGRWEILDHHPTIVADTGHNKEGIKCVVDQLKNTPHQNLHMVIGAVNDKDIGSILKLLPKKAAYYFCRPNIPRGLDEQQLFCEALKEGLKGSAYPSVKSAIKAAVKNAQKRDLIFIGGSTFVVADALKSYSLHQQKN